MCWTEWSKITAPGRVMQVMPALPCGNNLAGVKSSDAQALILAAPAAV